MNLLFSLLMLITVSPAHGAELGALYALCPDEAVDVWAVADGEWDDPRVWSDGELPMSGDRVLLPADRIVLLDGQPLARLKAIRIDAGGLLEFDPTGDTRLLVETIVVMPGGELGVGSPVSPVRASAEIVFLDMGEFDYMGFGRGLVSAGMVTCYGEERPFTTEVVKIDGRWESLADRSRNVLLRSENPDPTRAAHVMLMHHADYAIGWTCFRDLGRTNKAKPLSATNPRGRYALHYHRCGLSTPIHAPGIVIDGSPGWGAVNHSSFVLFDRCLADDCVGSGFTAEAGDERGAFHQIVGTNSVGSGHFGTPESLLDEKRKAISDFGHLGHAVWRQGPHCAVTESVAAGCGGAGFDLYNGGYKESDTGTVALKASKTIPIAEERDNTALDCRYGCIHSYAQAMPGAAHPQVGLVENFTAIGCGTGHFNRLSNITLLNATLDGCTIGVNSGVGNGYGGPTKLLNANVRNCATGFIATTDQWFGAHGLAIGGEWENNGVDVLIYPGLPGHTEIAGLPAGAKIVFAPGIEGKAQSVRERLFYSNTRIVTIDGRRAFFPEQHPDFKPWSSGTLKGLTNRQIEVKSGGKKLPLGAIVPAGSEDHGDHWLGPAE